MMRSEEQQVAIHTEDWKRELVEIYFSRRGTIWGITLLVFLCAAAIAAFWPATYVATGSIVLHERMPKGDPASLEAPWPSSMEVTKEDLATEQEILTSVGLLKQTLESLGGRRSAGDVRRIKKNLKAKVVLASRVIRLELYDKNAKRSEKQLDELLDQYLSYRRTVVDNPTTQEEFLAERAEMYKRKLEELEDRMIESADEGFGASLEREIESNVALKQQLIGELNTLRSQYVGSDLVSDKSLEARMKLIAMTIKDLEKRNEQLVRRSIELQRVSRESDLLEFSYVTFAKRSEEAQISRGITEANISGDVSILSRAALSAERAFPKRVLTLVLGLVVGFIAGCTLGFIAEYFDHTFKRASDVTRYAGLPVIGSIRKA